VAGAVSCSAPAWRNTDVFELHPQLDPVRERLWRLIEATPWLDLRPFLDDIQWMISGGQSSPHYRGFDVAWVRDINVQRTASGVAHFFKQRGGRTHAEGGCLLDGVELKQFPTTTLTVAA
jgi:protein gp37